MVQVSDKIKGRIIANRASFASNDNISQYIKEGELETLIDEVTDKMVGVLDTLCIDIDRDHNTQETARRVAKMFIDDIFYGRYQPMPKVTAFPNAKEYDQIYVSGPITVRSTCAHHMMPIIGKAYIGIHPGENVIGLSKFNRLVDWVASRPQIQEEMTQQIADIIEEQTQAKGIAIIVQAEHMCITHRGIREHESDMTTSIMRGTFREDPSLKNEFFKILDRMK